MEMGSFIVCVVCVVRRKLERWEGTKKGVGFGTFGQQRKKGRVVLGCDDD